MLGKDRSLITGGLSFAGTQKPPGGGFGESKTYDLSIVLP
jgi:hypothetical protein